MKLAKKMLACVMALAMVAALSVIAFAAPAVNVDATKAYVGDTVTLTVYGSDVAGLQSADLQFSYDADSLEYVSVKKIYDGFGSSVGGNPSAGLVTFSLVYMEANDVDDDGNPVTDPAAMAADDQFCTVTFKVLKAGNTDVKVHIESWDGIEQPDDFVVAITATEKPTETTTEKPTEAPATTTEPGTGDGGNGDKDIPQTGETGVAIIAGVMAVAAVAFVATRKKDEQ